MIEAPLALLTDLVVTIAVGIVEVSLYVLAASRRPWAYILSSSYRMRTDALLAGRPLLARAWYMTWGTLAVVASLIVAAGAVMMFNEWRTTEPTRTKFAADEIARKALGALRHSSQASSP